MAYHIYVREDTGRWRKSNNRTNSYIGPQLKRNFYPNESFVYQRDAEAVALAYHEDVKMTRWTGENKQGRGTRVVSAENPDRIVWEKIDNQEEARIEMDGTPDITEPIKLDRNKLIARLQEIHDEEEKTRKEAEAKREAEQKELIAFVKDNADRIAEFFAHRFSGGYSKTLERMKDEEFKDDNFKPEDSVPTRRESDSEKFVRVLGMSNDETVSLVPDQPLYQLL